jgi:hypothetical protein
MKATPVKPVRCAIYTRVSTDQGLDQEFNSLDAQYDASSAYIKSQAHAGWSLIKARYDDGGYSGGSTDRPDLQRLLNDIRYRYYASLPCLHGEARTANVGSVTRVPAADIEDVVVKSLNEYLTSQNEMPASAIADHGAIAELIDRIDVHKDRLAVRLKLRENPRTIKPADDIDPTDDRLLSIPWQKPPSKRFRQNPVASWRVAKGRPAGAAGTAPPSGQRHRARQALAGRDRLRFRD